MANKAVEDIYKYKGTKSGKLADRVLNTTTARNIKDEDSLRKFISGVTEKFYDRGKSGRAEADRLINEAKNAYRRRMLRRGKKGQKDLDLLQSYGQDAPGARSFMSKNTGVEKSDIRRGTGKQYIDIPEKEGLIDKIPSRPEKIITRPQPDLYDTYEDYVRVNTPPIQPRPTPRPRPRPSPMDPSEILVGSGRGGDPRSFKKGGKVRGAGIARKGIRKCKMV
jgi:hypothetical protein